MCHSFHFVFQFWLLFHVHALGFAYECCCFRIHLFCCCFLLLVLLLNPLVLMFFSVLGVQVLTFPAVSHQFAL
ncbi:hypothetical protein M758_UG264100 [Ceratodon purpureus]|nr:hypothetical protein M758_UG264100 [Ceratodon purpureus]